MNRSIRRMTATAAALFLMGLMTVPAQKSGGNKAIDDYNFAAWLYNQGKHELAADSYRAFLKAHAAHEKAADARFGLAQSLFSLDRFAEAAVEYEELRARAKDFPQRAEVLFQLAQCRVALKEFAAAEPLFGEVRGQFPAHYLADWSAARQAACRISLEQYEGAESLLAPFVDRYAPGGRKPADSEATRAMFRALDEAGVKAREAFLNLVERSEFYLAMARFNRGRFGDARGGFQRFLERYRESSLRDEAQFRLAQSLYQERAYAEAAAAYAAVSTAGEFGESAAFERGLALYKAGRIKEAAAAFSEMAARFPQSPQAAQAALYAGTFLYEAGDFAAAADRLTPLAGGDRESADEALYWLGMCRLKQGRTAEAETHFARGLRDFPKSARAGDVRLGLGDALLAQDKRIEAAAAFRAYAEAAPQAEAAPRALYSACVALHRADRFAESDEGCGQFLARHPRHELAASVLFLSGENRFLAQAPDRAAARYQELLKLPQAAPDQVAKARYRLAWIHRQARDYAAALKELDQVKPADAGAAIADEVSYLRGVCWIETGRAAEAVEALSQYLKAAARGRYADDALLKLAAAQAAAGRKDKARDAYERFLKEHPAHELAAQARYQLAELLFDLREFDKACAVYEKLADPASGSNWVAYALFGQGLCRDEQSRWADAIAAYDRLLAAPSGADLAPQALYRKGRGLMKLQRWAEADAVLNDFLGRYSKHELSRAARIALGYCRQELKQWREAAQAFRLAADQDDRADDLARVLYEQAWSWREAGDEPASREVFRRLARQYPADPLAADAWFYLAEAAYTTATAAAVEPLPAKALAEARELYEKVLGSKEKARLGDKALYRIGWIEWLTARYPEAAREFDRLVRDYPSSDLVPDSLFQAGQAHARTGQTEKAIAAYRALVENSRHAQFAYRVEAQVGWGEAALNGGDPRGAVKVLSDLLARSGTHAAAGEAFFLRGKAQFDLGEFDRALADFQEAVARGRGERAAQAQFYVGQAHQAKEDFRSALVAYLRIQALFSAQREWVAASHFESGKCHQALGAAAEARAAYQATIQAGAGTRWADLAADRLKSMKP